jgi:hypothetical protein
MKTKKTKPRPRAWPYIAVVKRWVKDREAVSLGDLLTIQKDLVKDAGYVFDKYFGEAELPFTGVSPDAFKMACKAVDAAIRAKTDGIHSLHWKAQAVKFIKQYEVRAWAD